MWAMSNLKSPLTPGVYKVKVLPYNATCWLEGFSKWDGEYWYERRENKEKAEASVSKSGVGKDRRQWWVEPTKILDWHEEKMKDRTFQKYWIVHNGGPTFTNKCKSFDEAAAVAKRNAKQCPGKAFYILETHSAVVVEMPEPTVLFPAPIIES